MMLKKKSTRETYLEEINMKDKNLGETINAIGKNLPKTTNSLDGFLSGIFEFFDLIITPVHFLKDAVDLKREQFKENLRIKASKIPSDHLKNELDISVIGPTLDALKYACLKDYLREMFENLLASSMDDREVVFPSFVDIVRQLNEDEARLLKFLCDTNKNTFPVINLIYKLNSERGFYEVFRNYSDITEGVCERPALLPEYIDDLIRFGIFNKPAYESIVDEAEYLRIESSSFINELKQTKFDKSGKFDINKGVVKITPFGMIFLKSCIKQK